MQVVLISGETGCGKTTQVPQFLLDDPSVGPTCSIVCTQPRRISAISVAERVASERGEAAGGTVGYAVRGDASEHARGGPPTQLSFVTPGLLLRRLGSDPSLQRYSHVLIDEVHEQDKYTEFLLVLLKRLLPQRPNLRVVLMSATLRADTFADFFGGCPNLTIGTSMFPVATYFLEDALRHTGFLERRDGVGPSDWQQWRGTGMVE
jgi:HrpA-like RNA helicase